jgi:hypothetical protein
LDFSLILQELPSEKAVSHTPVTWAGEQAAWLIALQPKEVAASVTRTIRFVIFI